MKSKISACLSIYLFIMANWSVAMEDLEERYKLLDSDSTPLMIPSENEQIKACLNFLKDPSKQNMNNLKEISKRNFLCIESIVKNRFGMNSKNFDEVKETLNKAEKLFDGIDGKIVSLKELSKLYYTFSSILTDYENYTIFKPNALKPERIDTSPLTPIPVLSKSGLINFGKLCDLFSSGIYPIGIPLNAIPAFDGTKGGARDFVEHDIGHGIRLLQEDVTNFNLNDSLRFSYMFDTILFAEVKTLSDLKLVNLIRFFIIHEENYHLDAVGMNFADWAISRLIRGLALINAHSDENLAGFIEYLKTKNVIDFSNKKESSEAEILKRELATKILGYVNKVNDSDIQIQKYFIPVGFEMSKEIKEKIKKKLCL